MHTCPQIFQQKLNNSPPTPGREEVYQLSHLAFKILPHKFLPIKTQYPLVLHSQSWLAYWTLANQVLLSSGPKIPCCSLCLLTVLWILPNFMLSFSWFSFTLNVSNRPPGELSCLLSSFPGQLKIPICTFSLYLPTFNWNKFGVTQKLWSSHCASSLEGF